MTSDKEDRWDNQPGVGEGPAGGRQRGGGGHEHYCHVTTTTHTVGEKAGEVIGYQVRTDWLAETGEDNGTLKWGEQSVASLTTHTQKSGSPFFFLCSPVSLLPHPHPSPSPPFSSP